MSTGNQTLSDAGRKPSGVLFLPYLFGSPLNPSASAGLGRFASYEDACREPELEATYTPDPSLRSYYQEKFRIFNALFSAQSESFSALNTLERKLPQGITQ